MAELKIAAMKGALQTGRLAGEGIEVPRTLRRRVSPWRDALTDCLVQACVATPWIVVSAVGRALFQGHS